MDFSYDLKEYKQRLIHNDLLDLYYIDNVPSVPMYTRNSVCTYLLTVYPLTPRHVQA